MIRLENITYRAGGRTLLDRVSIDMSAGKCWAITGANGSGKSLLAMIMGGVLKPSSGSISVEGETGYASFELQQRIMAEERKKDNSRFLQGKVDPGTLVRDFVCGGKHGFGETGCGDNELFVRYTSLFSIERILDRGLRYLSTGEFRKTLLCRALLSKPDILIVDDPFDGLDAEARKNLGKVLSLLVENRERIFIVTPRISEIPSWVTHYVLMENGKISSFGEYSRGSADALPSSGEACREKKRLWGDAAVKRISSHEILFTGGSGKPAGRKLAGKDIQPVIGMKNVNVAYDGARILTGIDWEVFRGDRWKISGPNGCGKSTLMSLVNGDNPKAYLNDISLFGRKRGSGESIWEIKKRIGFVSGDFQMNYRAGTTVLDTVLSGFFDSVGLYSEVTGLQREEALRWLEVSGLAEKKGMKFSELSYGEKRIVLVIRAFIKKSELVILDEPCQGLDDENTASVIEVINLLSVQGDNAILLVTHDSHIMPRGFDRHLVFLPHPDGGYTVSEET